MAVNNIFGASSIDDLADNVLSEVDDFMLTVEKMQKRKVASNVQLVVQALKKIESDLQDKYDGVTTVIEKRVSTIKDGKDGQNGANGRDGKDGRPGRDGAVGPRGVDGLNGSNGRDGEDGVSVTNAFIDFDGSLVINLSDGQSLNVGEVVAPDLAEKIKVITNGGGTSQGVLDTLTSLQNQINLISSALVYKGTWNASTNTPALASGVGTANSFYIVSVAGTTTLDGISNWGVGDWATFNGTAWQRVEGGAAGNFTTLTTSGAATIQGLTVGRGGSAVEGNTVAGANSLGLNTTGLYNTSVGFNALFLNADGNNNTGVGANSGVNNVSGDQNTSVGYFSLYNNASGNDNTAIGYAAGAVAVGSGNVMLGNRAGAYETGSNSFYVDNQNRTNTAGDKAGALLYGTFSATPASQTLKVNAALTATYDVTLSAGTANGVAYLNGSKVLTTGSALTFDGSNLTLTGNLNMTGGSIAFDDERFVYSYAGGSVGQYMSGTYYDGSGLTQRFYINNSEQMRLTSTGLGIGTSSPNYVATLYKASLPVLQFVNSTSGSTAGDGLLMYLNGANATISNEEVGSINFQTSGLLRATLDASGNLGLGVTPSAWGTSEYKAVQVGIGASFYGRVTAGDQDKAGVSSNAFNNGTNWLYIATDSAANYTQIGGGHFFYTAPSGTAGDSITFTQAMTLDASGNLGVGTTSPGARVDVRGSATDFDGLRIINTSGNSGVATKASLRLGITNSIGIRNTKIQAIEDSADDNGVSLAFFTNSANALDSEVERARITSGGDLLVGTTSAIQASRFGVLAGSSTNCIAAQNTNNNNYLYTGTNSSNTEVFRVAGSGDVLNTNNSYGALSDSKLKENITDATSKLEKLNQVRVVNFNMIGSEHKQIGVIAQELEQVFPGMVDETPDRDQEGNGLGTTTKSVKYSVFVPMLIKAMQELKAEFDAYKASHP